MGVKFSICNFQDSKFRASRRVLFFGGFREKAWTGRPRVAFDLATRKRESSPPIEGLGPLAGEKWLEL